MNEFHCATVHKGLTTVKMERKQKPGAQTFYSKDLLVLCPSGKFFYQKVCQYESEKDGDLDINLYLVCCLELTE